MKIDPRTAASVLTCASRKSCVPCAVLAAGAKVAAAMAALWILCSSGVVHVLLIQITIDNKKMKRKKRKLWHECSTIPWYRGTGNE